MSAPKIRVDRLGKTFGDEATLVQALQDFSLTMNDGEFVCLVGPSGCGKTTALRIVGGLEKPTSGTVEIGRMVEIDSYSRPLLHTLTFGSTGFTPVNREQLKGTREEAIEGAARPGIRRGDLVLKEGMGLEIEPNT